MSGDEFKDLQNFGKTIEDKQNDKVEVEQNIKKDLQNVFRKSQEKKVSFDTQKTKYFFKKISKRIIFTKIRLVKYGENVYFKIQKLKKIRVNFPRQQKNYVKCYRLVEKRKQRRNKTIIVRKRVPFKIGLETLGHGRSDLENLIHLTFESGVYYNTHRPTTKDHKLKESVWDFKLK